MSKKSKPQQITFKSILRLILFLFIVFILISWFSSQKPVNNNFNDPTVYVGETLGSDVFNQIYQKLPESSRYQLEHFNQTPVGIWLKNTSSYIGTQLNGFPQKQIKEIKKAIIKNISDDMIRNIDQN